MKAVCRDLGRMDYKTCWEMQQRLFDALAARKTQSAKCGEATDGLPVEPNDAGTILLVEHPPVYTLGKSGRAENLLIDRQALETLGAQFFHIDRGGDITFHGPGQLVCYPILDLERIGIGLRAYIDALEEAVIRTVAFYGIRAGRIAGASGVWIGEEADAGDMPEKTGKAGNAEARFPERKTEETVRTDNGQITRSATVCATVNGRKTSRPRKICAIGVRSSRYITMHGFALNVSTDLAWFSRINPCGFTDWGVTSIEAETGRHIPMDEVKDLVTNHLSKILNVKIYK